MQAAKYRDSSDSKASLALQHELAQIDLLRQAISMNASRLSRAYQ
jgi:hypothetical protein